jgi:hypothetical protein
MRKAMLDELLRKLNSPEEEIRAVAIAEARTLPPESLLQLARQASRLHTAQTAPNVFIGPVSSWLEFVRRTGKYLRVLVSGRLEDWETLPKPSQALYSLAEIVGETEDVRLLELAFTLLERSRYHADIVLPVHPALKRLLPKVTVEQASLWTEDRKDVVLSFLLLPYRDLQMTLAVLHALEQIGDESIIPTVRELARKGFSQRTMRSAQSESLRQFPTAWSGYDRLKFQFETLALTDVTPEKVRQVKQAAQKCLLYLDMRLTQTQQSRILLRPSDALQASASETLLRPAAEGEMTIPPEHLLRPVEEQGGKP